MEENKVINPKNIHYVFKVDLQVIISDKYNIHLSGIDKNGVMNHKESIVLPCTTQLLLAFENINPYYSLFDNDRTGYLIYDLPEFNCDSIRLMTTGDNIRYHSTSYIADDGPTGNSYYFINQKLKHTDYTGIYLSVAAHKHPVNTQELTETLNTVTNSDRWHIKAPTGAEDDWDSLAIEYRKTRSKALEFERLFYKKLYKQFYWNKGNKEVNYPYWDNEQNIFVFHPNDSANEQEFNQNQERDFEDFLIDLVFNKKLYDDLHLSKAKQIINPSIAPTFQQDQVNKRFTADAMISYIRVNEIKRFIDNGIEYTLGLVTIKREANEYFEDQIVTEIWTIPSSFLTQNLIY